MNFATLYRGSLYLMLFFATLTLSVDVEESPVAMLYPVAVAVAGVLAMLTVDRNPRLSMPRHIFNWLALASVGLVYVEFSSNPDLLLLALAHWLVYLQLIKMFLPKRVQDDWFLFLLGLMQVLVGAVQSQSDQVGLTMSAWAVLALWVMALFSLHRDALRFRQTTGDPAVPATGVPEADPYPGLLNFAYLMTALRVTGTTIALGGVIFLAMPRQPSMARLQNGVMLARHLTGFDEEVKLGQLGEILENDSVVMSIELFDADWKRIGPPAEPLWRGATMSVYDNGRWHRQRWDRTSFPSGPSRRKESRPLIRQRIRLEATDSPVLFGLRPMVEATSSPRSSPYLNAFDGTIVRSDPRSETFDYRVDSEVDPDKPQIGERLPGLTGKGLLLEIPPKMRNRLRTIAEREVAGIGAEFPLRRARALEQYLRSSGLFHYSLHLSVDDRKIDPVLDFLDNRKSGHCGYFASALTLLLRSIDIPARMVNGFKGGDWNDLAQVLSVRQKYAHSWVEALIARTDDESPTWVTLDPTPGAARNEAVARVGGFASNFRQVTDLVRYVWVFYIVGYNADRQRFLLYDPIRALVEEARNGFQMMRQALQNSATSVFGFRDFAAFISYRGFFVSFFLLLTLAGMARGTLGLWWVGKRWLGGDPDDSASLSASQVSFRRLTHLLAPFGLERPYTETQHEFAGRASAFLTGRGSSTAGVADVPPLVVDAFYHVRFGHRELSPVTLEQLDRRLDALEASLNANAG